MNEQEIQNIEIRVRRLEQLHIWGISIIAIGALYLILKRKN